MDAEDEPTGQTFHVKSFEDILAIPAERRGEFFKALEVSLLVYELAFGEDAPLREGEPLDMTWTDDGKNHHKLLNRDNGEVILSLDVQPQHP